MAQVLKQEHAATLAWETRLLGKKVWQQYFAQVSQYQRKEQ